MCDMGYGLKFVKAGIDYFFKKTNMKRFRLTVASFNRRAIKVYERTGFVYKTTFVKQSSDIEFNVMIYKGK
jgi:RimJ/RimL family protein N-acetyltransferase